MPRARPVVASFWVLRPEEHPEAEERNYPGMLRILQRSCDRLSLRHVVLTDHATRASAAWPDGVEAWPADLPGPLMRACTEAQARFLETAPEGDTLFVGADSILLRDPSSAVPRADLCLTLRPKHDRYPINSGFQYIRRESAANVAAVYREIANQTGTKWCDDQRAMQAVLAPMPPIWGTFKRAGINVAFLPMKRFNDLPRSIDDSRGNAFLLHFRGKGRKKFYFDWAKNHGFA